MRVASPVLLDNSQQRTLEQWARSRSLPARQVERAKVVLLAADGRSDLEISAALRISNQKAASLAQTLPAIGTAGAGKGCAATGPQAGHSGQRQRGVGSQNYPIQTQKRDPLEHAHDGCRNGCQ